MNFVAIMGGLGNQFFQYAFYRYIREKSNNAIVITKYFYDYLLKLHPEATYREFDLDKYDVIYSEISGMIPNNCIRKEDFKQEYLKYDNYFYEGYWNDSYYYKEIADILRNELKLKRKFIDDNMLRTAEEMKKCESVSVHIRRGDYLNAVNSTIFENLQMEYYQYAVKYIKERLGSNIKLYIFSDDIDYVKASMDSFGSLETVIMDKNAAYKDHWLMSKAKHHIIANSTYSLWSCYLSDYIEGITVVPSKWFKNKITPDLYDERWTVI